MNTTTDPQLRDDVAQEAPGSLAGKVCVVTGGSRGIGRTVVTELASHGATVVVNYLTSGAEADEVVDGIVGDGGDAVASRADVSDYDSVQAMAERVHDEFGPIDVLVNNAGITADGRFERLSREDWDRVIDVNLGGAFNCTKAFYEDVKAADEGRVVNVGSIVGQRGNFGQVNYAAAKSGLCGFTKSLARELAPYDATANCVAPGFTRTDMVQTVPAEVRERLLESIPLHRFAEVEEIACVVRFLAGDESSYVSGEVINVNGGMYA